ncbi:putative serine/threonine-protein kinase [Geobacter sp. OR-1]|uniref:protein kinase domain-containing protein n=1 Tax=Geobacter sp. OR-1 TaxID=1266765 RepID=UPI0005440586|nr:protein kinase [Geobacter sp. OR-1]GAM11825.1 putative serine/threonine-protein kinase [Geobacter sp. OR-1]
MSASQNIDYLVSELLKVTCLNNRFTNIKCVNWPPDPGENKRGNFSLVFKAFDTTTNKTVAIKFMDPSHLGNDYRINCFKREPKILDHILNKPRCLQIVDKINSHIIEIKLPNGFAVNLPCDYFVTDWIDYDIDDYFFNKDNLPAKLKLTVFKLVLLAVDAIHKNGIFHRDLKPDNMRANSSKIDDKVVFVIDFGTAAQYDSAKILEEYTAQVGANLYSAPEAFLGFSGERNIAKFTDIYALGCMLYELFNDSLYFESQISNPNYRVIMTTLGVNLMQCKTLQDKIACWNSNMSSFSKMVDPPDFYGDRCTLPASIISLIEPLYKELVAFDFNKRLCNFDKIRNRIDTAIKVLDNDLYQRKKIEHRKLLKLRAIEKTIKKEARLTNYLTKIKSISC